MMKTRLFLVLILSGFVAAHAEPPPVPDKPIAKKKELLFSDDFESATPKKEWGKVVPTFAIENGMLKGTQTRLEAIPAHDGKPAQPAHQAVFGLDVPTKDSVVEVRIKFGGATSISVEQDDRNYTGSHYGHIATAQVHLDNVTIIDQKDGIMSNAVYAMKDDPTKKGEVAKLVAGRKVSFPVKLEPEKWYNLMVETVGDAMRVSIDGKAVGYLKSSGIGHPTKSKFEFGVYGNAGYYDDIKVWSAEPAK